MRIPFLIPIVLCSGCGVLAPKPTAQAVCSQLVTEGLAARCREDLPGGAGARASAMWVYDVPGTPGATAAVYSFATSEDYAATVNTFAGLAVLAGPHRYGSPGRLIFVQANDKAPLEYGRRLRATIEGL